MTTSYIKLRPVQESDMAFLLSLYATTRADELAQVDWNDEQKQAFVVHQFNAQHEHWQKHYTNTSWDLIEQDGVPIGRFYVARWAEEIRIVDIALLPETRNSGIGTRLIRDVFEEADSCGKKVTVHVEIYNPAQRLYERLGFTPAHEVGVYRLMERLPRVQSTS